MVNNANPCGEFSNHYCHVSKVQEIAGKLTCMYSAIWCLIHSTLSGVRAERGHPSGLVSFTDPSWCHFSSHNTTVLQPGASHLWKCCEKPHCIAVTDSVLIDNSTTAAVWCCTDHCFISTKLQMSLYTIVVSMETPCNEYTGFQISKTVRCFWCIL